MIALIQRVKSASVSIDGILYSKINNGILVFLGISVSDKKLNVEYLAKKINNLRIFSDNNNKMNLSIQDTRGSILVVSQFTLYGQCNKGNRPSFINVASQEKAQPLYETFIQLLKKSNINVESGKFGARMNVKLNNDGPVTLIVES